MANLVPKVNNVGKLGTSSKLWNEVHQTTSLFGTASITEESNVLKVKDAPLTVEQNLTVGQSLAITAQSSSLDLNSQKIINLATPTSNGDAASKAYVDSVAQGLDVKDSVRVATTAALTLASDLENGDTVDGVVLATGDRVLVKDQASASENGIYVVAASGAPSRSADFAASSNAAGTFVFVEEGTANADAGFVCTSNSGSDVVGTNTLAFSQFSGAGAVVAGDGLDKTGNTLSVNVDDSSLEIDTDTLRIKAAGVTSSMLSSSAVDNTNLAAASITGQTAETTIADDDLVLIYDTSATALRKMTKANFVTGLSGGAAADDITVGDAAVTLATTSGNITIDAQGDNTDIILKGTDGGVDTTFLTLDGSNAGTATFNNSVYVDGSDLRLRADSSSLRFGQNSEVYFQHAHDSGLTLVLSSPGSDEPKFKLQSSGSDNTNGPNVEFYHSRTNFANGDVAGSLTFKAKGSASVLYTFGDIRGIVNNVASGDWRGQFDLRVLKGASNSIGTALSVVGNASGGSTVDVTDHDGAAEGLKLGGTLITSTAAELNALDVSSESPSDNEVLTYTAGNGLHWAAVSGGGGSAPTVTAASPSSAYTISTYSGIEEVYLLNPSASITVNLPSAATAGSGYKYQIKNLSTNTITLDPSSTETIDASTTVDISTQYSSLTIVSDGTNWFII